jgi:glycosyltransferase involved in cell wall biosynthesis
MDPAPTVSIGVPIYNGGQKLPRCLDSILAQSFEDFEVIICDNGSTDETREIVEEYVGRDARVRQIRWPVNQGAAWNFNSAFAQARGAFFH